MSLRALFGDKAAALLRRDWSADPKGVQLLARELYNILNSNSPIEMREPLQLHTFGSNPAIEIVEEDATTATIRVSKYAPGETAQETVLSSSGIRSEHGDLATVLTSSDAYAESAPDSQTDVLGAGNKNLVRFVTATDEDGNKVAIGGPGAAGNFGGFQSYSGLADGVIRPFTLNEDLAAGENFASAEMLNWDPIGLAFAGVNHNFLIGGHFLPGNRLSGDKLMALFDPFSEKFFAIA